jgi:uncharacterized protein YggL (DUF469 family)
MLELYQELTEEIKKSYEQGITIEEAEKMAGKFLYAQIQISEELRVADLNARMKKSGVKAIKAAVYLEEASKTERKPSDVMLSAIIDRNEIVQAEQMRLDEAEVDKLSLENYLNIFQQAHHYYKSIAKQNFGG